MEHKNSFHIKKLNHQSGDSWTKTMRAGYVWLAAILCFIWYAAGRFEMYMAGVLLFVGAAFLILLYLAGISAGKGFAIFISSLYFVVPFFQEPWLTIWQTMDRVKIFFIVYFKIHR